MAYDYYCVSCGQKLNQGKVLFDMQYVLTGREEAELNILKFCLLESELRQFVDCGDKVGGMTRCKLPFSTLVGIMSNANNLNRKELSTLTLAEVEEYIKRRTEIKVSAPAAGPNSEPSDPDFPPFQFGFDEPEEQTPPEEATEEEETYIPPAALLALEGVDEANMSDRASQLALVSELTMVRNAFQGEETMEFLIELLTEKDNLGNDVLYGYTIQNEKTGVFVDKSYNFKRSKTEDGHMSTKEDPTVRLCPHCGARILNHAGTAKHQSIAFIGYQSSGKTSTILSLASYAVGRANRPAVDQGDENGQLWVRAQVEPVEGIQEIELLSPTSRLREELNLFRQGYAPEKTVSTARESAYTASFRVRNKVSDQYHLITLTDLPGELYLEGGAVDMNNLLNHFPVAVSCDAYIVCFDTRPRENQENVIGDMAMTVCSWANEVQARRNSRSGEKENSFVPMMMLFTKCQELEEDKQPVVMPRLTPLKAMYYLKEERQAIFANPVYRQTLTRFAETGALRYAFQSAIRCSPYGYRAPKKSETESSEEKRAQLKSPEPKNIDKLMWWILGICGGIPVKSRYSRDGSANARIVDDYCLDRIQYRQKKPEGKDPYKEAMARCTLFDNPGEYDQGLVTSYDDWAQRLILRTRMRTRPDGNAE